MGPLPKPPEDKRNQEKAKRIVAESIRQSPLEGPGVWGSGKAQMPPTPAKGLLFHSLLLTIKVCSLLRGLREVAK